MQAFVVGSRGSLEKLLNLLPQFSGFSECTRYISQQTHDCFNILHSIKNGVTALTSCLRDGSTLQTPETVEFVTIKGYYKASTRNLLIQCDTNCLFLLNFFS